MNHSTIKNFNSSSSSQGAEGVARSPSPPILIPEARPIQEDQVDAFSQVLVTSLSCPSFRKSYGATAEASMNGSLSGAQGNSLDHGMPTLEPAMKSLSSCEQDESLPSASGGASPLLASLTPAQRLGEKEEDICVFMSEEITAKIPHPKLLRCSSKKGHTWDRRIFVDASKRKGVKVHVFLHPKIRNADGLENTNLNVVANVRSRQLPKLRGCGKKCWVIVDTNILDRGAGKSLYRTEGTPYPINVDDGQVNFSQVVVPYEQAKSCACEHVTLLIKVIFVTAFNVFNLKDDKEEDGFMVIEKE